MLKRFLSTSNETMATGRVAIVTGSDCGLGYDVAKCLCESGNDIIMACKDEELAKQAINKLKEHKPDAIVSFMQLDLLSMESIRNFVNEFHAAGKQLHLLVNCFGVKPSGSSLQRLYSADNFELTMAANHLGQYLLTNLLLTDLKSTAATEGNDVRVVVLTSPLHDVSANKSHKNLQPLDIDNIFLFNDKTYNGSQAYKNSRAANLLFTYELARRTQDTGVKVFAVCPGVEPVTEATANGGSGMQRLFSRVFTQCISAPVSTQQAAMAIATVCTEAKYKDLSGKYIRDGEEVESSEETRNEELQSKLWEISARLVKMEGFEPLELTPPAAEEPVVEKDKEKKDKKSKKEKNGEKSQDEEAVVVENGHTVEQNGETTKDDDNKEKKVDENDANQEIPDETSKTIEQVEKNGKVISQEDKHNVCNGEEKVDNVDVEATQTNGVAEVVTA